MDHTSELRAILNEVFNWNKARMTCLVLMIQALFVVRTVNLVQIATAFTAKSKEESAYRRICRFLTDFSFDISSIALLVLKLFPLTTEYILILDRTNWKWGKTSINILMLSIAYQGVSIPFFWTALDSEGNSCVEDRVSLVKCALKKFPPERIHALLADREFVGKEWFDFLIDMHIPFVIRVKGNYKAIQLDSNISEHLKHIVKRSGRKKKVLNAPIEMWDHQLYLSFQKGKKGAKEPMIVVSNYDFEDALKLYRRRWETETLFGCLKTRGFYLEDTHVTDSEKIEKILFVLAIAFCLAFKAGEIKSKKSPIPRKAHGRPEKSVFRIGLDLIRRGFLGIEAAMDEMMQVVGELTFLFTRSCNV